MEELQKKFEVFVVYNILPKSSLNASFHSIASLVVHTYPSLLKPGNVNVS
jgi:hypothetical protein